MVQDQDPLMGRIDGGAAARVTAVRVTVARVTVAEAAAARVTAAAARAAAARVTAAAARAAVARAAVARVIAHEYEVVGWIPTLRGGYVYRSGTGFVLGELQVILKVLSCCHVQHCPEEMFGLALNPPQACFEQSVMWRQRGC